MNKETYIEEQCDVEGCLDKDTLYAKEVELSACLVCWTNSWASTYPSGIEFEEMDDYWVICQMCLGDHQNKHLRMKIKELEEKYGAN